MDDQKVIEIIEKLKGQSVECKLQAADLRRKAEIKDVQELAYRTSYQYLEDVSRQEEDEQKRRMVEHVPES